MLTTSASPVLGFAFVLAGGVNVWLVLEAWSRVKATNASSRTLALHGIGGPESEARGFVSTCFGVTVET